MRAADIHTTARASAVVDRAIQTAADSIDGALHRQFFPEDKTCSWDWPNFQRAYPWRLWLDRAELADVTVNPPVVTAGGSVIDAASILWGHPNYSPPFTYLELNRGTSASFGVGSTPQRDITIAGTYGYWIKTDSAGTLAADIDNAITTVTTSDGSLLGVGQVLIIGTERMLVSEVASTDTGATLSSGGTAKLDSDVALTVSDGTKVHAGEVLLIGSERMLAIDVSANVVTVKRAWDGSVLATHSALDKVLAYRTWTVVRGSLGTAGAAHTTGAACSVLRVPSLIRDLSIGESVIQVAQELGAYSDRAAAIASGIVAKWAEAKTAFARQLRQRAI